MQIAELRSHRRPGFTLVEMLVSTALVLFIMVILTQAFVAGLETFRQLKALGDMENNLRVATFALRTDLEHLYLASSTGGLKKLSDADFWSEGPPNQGFFRLWQGSNSVSMNAPNALQFAQQVGQPFPTSFLEGNDPDGNPSTYATDHYLHFTVKLSGERRKDYFSTRIPTHLENLPISYVWPGYFFLPSPPWARPLPPGAGPAKPLDPPWDSDTHSGQPRDSRFEEGEYYHSPVAEVAYYLRRIGTTSNISNANMPSVPTSPFDGGNQAGTPLYALYRHRKLLIPNNTLVNHGTPGVPTNVDRPPWQVYGPAQLQHFLSYNNSNSNLPQAAPFAELSVVKRSGDYFGNQAYAAPNNTLYFNDPSDVTIPQRRFGMNPLAQVPGPSGGVGGWPLRDELRTKTPTMPAPLGPADMSYPRYGDVVVPPGVAPSVILPSMSLHPLLGQDPTLEGSDLLLSNVLSMSISLLSPASEAEPFDSRWVTLFDQAFDPLRRNPVFYQRVPPPALPATSIFPNPQPINAFRPAVFDTWTQKSDPVYGEYTASAPGGGPSWANTDPNVSGNLAVAARRVPIAINIRALRITLRVWDARTQQTRQLTIIQPM